MGTSHASKIIELQNAETDIIQYYYYTGKSLGRSNHLDIVLDMIYNYNLSRYEYCATMRRLEIMLNDKRYSDFFQWDEIIADRVPEMIEMLKSRITSKQTNYDYACRITTLKSTCKKISDDVLSNKTAKPTIVSRQVLPSVGKE